MRTSSTAARRHADAGGHGGGTRHERAPCRRSRVAGRSRRAAGRLRVDGPALRAPGGAGGGGLPRRAAAGSAGGRAGGRHRLAAASSPTRGCKRLIELALQNNRDLRIAVLNIEQRARAVPDPARRPVPHRDARRHRLAPAQRAPASGNSSYYTAGLNITGCELDLFGRVRSLSDAALAQYLATEEARKAAQISLVAAVANTYLTLLADDEQLEVTRKTLDTREETLPAAAAEASTTAPAPSSTCAQAESLVEGARAALALLHAPARAGPERAGAAGRPAAAARPAAGPAAGKARACWPSCRPALPSELLERRPDVRQAEQQLMAANANIGAARAAFFPRITLTGSVGTGQRASWRACSSSRAWHVRTAHHAADLRRRRATRPTWSSSQANRDIAVAQYERSIQTAFREVADALAGRATLGEQLRAQQAQVAGRGDALPPGRPALSQRRVQLPRRAGCAARAVPVAAGRRGACRPRSCRTW